MKQIRLLLVAIFAATMYPAAYGQQPSVRNIPADKKEIIDRFIAGTLDPSYTPALFFGHFGNGKKLGEGALKAHLSLFLKGGADILKVQTEQPMPRVQDLTMETPLVPEDYYRPTLELIKDILSYVGSDVYVMPTILSTHQVARQGFGDNRLPIYAVERPEAYKRMLDSYTKAILWFIRECKAAGVEAFFTATQGGEKKFYELKVPKGFFETYIKPYDLQVMGEANKDTKIAILFINLIIIYLKTYYYTFSDFSTPIFVTFSKFLTLIFVTFSSFSEVIFVTFSDFSPSISGNPPQKPSRSWNG